MKNLILGLLTIATLNSYADEASMPYLKTIKLNNGRQTLYSPKTNPDLVCKKNGFEKSVKASITKTTFEVEQGVASRGMPKMVIIDEKLELETVDFEYLSHSAKLHSKECIAFEPDSDSSHDWKCEKYIPAHWGTIYTANILNEVVCDTGLLVETKTISLPRSPEGLLISVMPDYASGADVEAESVCKLLGFNIHLSHKNYESFFRKVKIAYVAQNTQAWGTGTTKRPLLLDEITCGTLTKRQ